MMFSVEGSATKFFVFAAFLATCLVWGFIDLCRFIWGLL